MYLLQFQCLEIGRGMQNSGGKCKGYARVGVRLQIFYPHHTPTLEQGSQGYWGVVKVQFVLLLHTLLFHFYSTVCYGVVGHFKPKFNL